MAELPPFNPSLSKTLNQKCPKCGNVYMSVRGGLCKDCIEEQSNERNRLLSKLKKKERKLV
jgi:uncharacterized OB-fold protein